MKKSILLFASIFVVLSACDSDDNNPMATNNDIYGNWTVESGDEFKKYLIINTDNTFYWLEEYLHGFRKTTGGVCHITENQINFDGGELFNTSISNNLLELSHPDRPSLVCRKDDNAPAKEDWIKTLNSSQSIAAPIDDATDIAYDGQYLWYGNAYASDYLYKIDPSNTMILETLEISQSAWAVEWAAGSLWVSSNGSDNIYKIDPSDGSSDFTSVDMGAWIEGIAFDGQSLWCTSNNEQMLYQYDPNNNSISKQIYLEEYPDGLCYANGFLYVCVNGVINKCSTNPFQVEEAYSLEKGNVHGITYDGSNFWVALYNYNEAPRYSIEKVAL